MNLHLQLRAQNLQRKFEAVVRRNMVVLNPAAQEFRQTNGPTVIMGPLDAICFMFQFNKCSKHESHHAEDGSLQLHVCQACFIIKGVIVKHTFPGTITLSTEE